ncbi:hypothetical protein GPA19_05355 [Azoarcus indigens]|uniref:Bacteriophage lambda head decoration protein D n=1 Tax=Azoarcus indigens TaxID=29545 RepID=A0A4R6DWL1_9RHOO|nr:hypothetical protein [Azoarcus indigens]NMG64372.1 hypothetical protein [Azoarcus indigens]TDN49174.1 hypothetical protein C7389_11225 [Azoarcus indigens]
MAQRFLARLGGETKQVEAKAASVGAADAGKIPALGDDGRLDGSMMPAGIGADTQILPASEALAAGTFVNIWADAGVAKVRLADNSNGRPADGYVLEAVSSAADATVYPLDGTNSALTGLAPGSKYYLGTAGAVTATALDETNSSNANKISQYLGKAKSVSELITTDDGYVVL